MGLTLADLCAILLAVALALLLRDRLKQKNNLPLPPGPKKYPFIGNVLSIPRAFVWETYARWGRECGLNISVKITLLRAHDVLGSDIIHLEGPGLSLIVLNSVKSVTDLLDKRSAIYSSRSALFLVFFLETEANNTHRPRATMVNEL